MPQKKTSTLPSARPASRRGRMDLPSALAESFLALIGRTTSDLPSDVERGLTQAVTREARGSQARATLETLLENIQLARTGVAPLCQDTGTLYFSVRLPSDFPTQILVTAARQAVAEATRRGLLRQNTVNSLTGESHPQNLAEGSPVFHFIPSARSTPEVRLIMKGGGSENVSTQFSLPDESIGANRDVEGIRRCVLEAVVRAQGNGCAPGVLGVCIGGDRAGGYQYAKEQFFRELDDVSPDGIVAEWEKRWLVEINSLGIGPMGLGGKTTLLGLKIGTLSRVPASFFVTTAYMCWAFRRRGLVLTPEGGIHKWLY
jgi:fumarate hydratase class I